MIFRKESCYCFITRSKVFKWYLLKRMSYLYHIYRENVYPTISSLFYILQTWFDNLPVTMWRRRQGAHALIFMSTEQGRNLYLNLGTLLDFWGNIVNHRPTCTRLLIIYLSVGATHMDFGVNMPRLQERWIDWNYLPDVNIYPTCTNIVE